MSFYSNPRNPGPGPISGSASDGLKSRVCIACKRVLDSCNKQLSMEGTVLVLTDITPPGAVPPYTFISALSSQIEAAISNLRVSRLEEKPAFARIQCDVTTPLRVTFKDANGDEYNAQSQITVPADVIMFVPDASVFPFEIVAASSCNSVSGEYVNPTTFTCTMCQALILKVIAETDLLLPVYGYCPSPKAVDYEAQVCNKFFDLPLYPSGK